MSEHEGASPVLPSGWRWACLDEVCTLNPRRPVIARASDAPTTFVQMSAVAENGKGIPITEMRPFEEVRSGYTYFAENDVLFAKITPCMQNGKHAIARGLCDGFGFGSTEFHVIRPGNDILPEWVHAFLVQPQVLNEATKHFSGAVGQQRVPASFLASLSLPLPSLAEQQRIVAILDEQMVAVERVRAAVEAQLVAARLLSGGYVRVVFEAGEAADWERRKLSDIAQTTSGTTPSRGRIEYYRDGTIPWVKTGELRDGVITETAEHITQSALRDTSLKLLPPNTLLIAMYGQGQTRGRTGLLAVPATINQACLAILPNDHLFDVTYLQWWFRHSYLRLRQESEGRGGNQPNLNGDMLRNQYVPLPSLNEQRHIVARLAAQVEAAERIRWTLEAQQREIIALPEALLQQAFSGKLTALKPVSLVLRPLPKGSVFTRGAIASYILDKTYRQPTMGRVKFVKMLYLSETHVGIDLYGNYERKAAGPLDANYLINLESLARKQHWFYRHDRGGEGYFYRPGDAIADRVRAAVHVLGERRERMDAMLNLFAPLDTERTEIVATLFAAWNDFLIDGYVPSDTAIISEVLERWHEAKQRIPEERWRDALRWMRREGFVPTGMGPRTETGNG